MPTLRTGMQPETLRVSVRRTQSVPSGVTTQSVGTIDFMGYDAPTGRGPRTPDLLHDSAPSKTGRPSTLALPLGK
jgi:hypothetical protein